MRGNMNVHLLQYNLLFLTFSKKVPKHVGVLKDRILGYVCN